MLSQRALFRLTAISTVTVVTFFTAKSIHADLIVHLDPNVLTTQFSDGGTGGGSVPAMVYDTVGFVTDVRSPTPGAPSGDGFVDLEGSATDFASRPMIVPHFSQGTIWEWSGDQRLLGRTGVAGNTDGVGTNFDTNTITAIVVGRVNSAGSSDGGSNYLFDFRDDTAGGGTNTDAVDGFALRYDYATGMLEGVAKQAVNASVPLPVSEWFVATYAWDGNAASATLSVQTFSGINFSNTAEAETAALAVDRWRPGTDANNTSGAGWYGSMGDLLLYNDLLDHSAVANQLANDYFSIPEVVIDRDSGNISISNNTASSLTNVIGYKLTSVSGTLDPSQWTSIADTYDASAPAMDQIDPDNNWTKLTNPNSRTDLSEAEFEGNGGANNGADFLTGTTTSLGNAWIKHYKEDVAMELLFDNGDIITLDVRYTGNGGQGFLYGDLDFDGDVDANDFYDVLLPNFKQDTSSLNSEAERYNLGDLDGDGIVDLLDFIRMNNAYTAANPGGPALSFGNGVPEPASMALLGMIVTGLVLRCRHTLKFMRCLFLFAVALFSTVSISSQFAKADLVVHFDPNVLSTMFSDGGYGGGTVPSNIGDIAGFISDVRSPTPGGSNPPDAWIDMQNNNGPIMVTHPYQGTVWEFIDDMELGVRDNNANLTGFGTNFDVNTMTAILVGRAGSGGAGAEQFFGFRDDFGDLNNATGAFELIYDHDTKMLQGMTNQTINTSVPLLQDEWFVASYVWNGGAASATLTVETLSGVVSNTGVAGTNQLEPDTFRLGANAAGTTSTRLVGNMGDIYFYNDVLDHTDVFDQLVEDYLPRPVTVNTTTGEISIKNILKANNEGLDINIDAYRISSASGSLNATAWNSLDEQNFDGGIWTELDTDPTLLSEGAVASNSLIEFGDTFVLGNAFNTAVGVQDLIFEVHFAGDDAEDFVALDLKYVMGAPQSADFDNDGDVDGSDFLAWQAGNGAAGGLAQGDANGDGNVNAADLAVWKGQYGNGNGGGSLAGVEVPEASSIALFLVSALATAVTGVGYKRKRNS